MLQACCRFRFQTKTFEVRFRGPLAKPDDLQCNGAIETFLARPKDHALTAASDFLQQFVIAKFGHRFDPIRIEAIARHRRRFTCVFIFIGKRAKAGLKETRRAETLRRVDQDFRSALSTNSNYATHRGGAARALAPIGTAQNSVTRYVRNTEIKWRSSSSTSLGMATVLAISSRKRT